MKVKIGPHPKYYTIFNICDALKYVGLSEDRCESIAEKLSWKKWIDSSLSLLNRRKRKIKVKIDKYDTWNLDNTLAHIILPSLIQLRETKHGSGFIDLEDVPERLRYTETEDWDPQKVFDFYKDDNYSKDHFCNVHTRYDWAISEMIWAFQQLLDDNWEDRYWTVKPEIDFSNYPEDDGEIAKPIRWSTRGECDWEGRRKHQERIDYGLYLFGKYYQTLWD